jgi:hypothetical protein
MAAKLTRLTHRIAIQLRLLAESCIICSFRSRRLVRKLLDTPSYSDTFSCPRAYSFPARIRQTPDSYYNNNNNNNNSNNRSLGSSVSIKTRLRHGRLGFNSRNMIVFFSSPPRPDRLWCATSLLSNGYRGLLLRG